MFDTLSYNKVFFFFNLYMNHYHKFTTLKMLMGQASTERPNPSQIAFYRSKLK